MSAQETNKGVVLVVDDSEDIRMLMGLILRTTYDVVEAQNGQEALNLLESRDVDVIILDENMPVMGGHECYSKLRAKSNVTPVIFCTGMPSEEYQKREFQTGAFDYLTKPVDIGNLIQLVNEAYTTKQRLASKQTRVLP